MFRAFKNIFNLGPKNFLGIDVGTSFIRIVEIEKRGREYRLSNYGELGESSFNDQPFRTSERNAFSLSNQNIAEAITAILREAEIRTKEVNFSIPDFCSFFINFELPVIDKKKISKAVRYQVRPFVPLPLKEVELDWLVIEGKPSKTPLKILVVVIPKEIIVQYQKIANLVGLKLRFLESEVFSLSRSLVRSENKKTSKIIGLIDIGAWSTTCSILEDGVLRNSYSFNIAGNELTRVIDKSLNIRYNEAEELKKRYGLISANSEPKEFIKNVQNENTSAKVLPEILTTLIDSILEEIKKVFRDFYRVDGKEVDKIVLAGGTALMPGLREYFEKKLNKKVVRISPFSAIAYPSVLSPILKGMDPTYGIAVGLALKGLE